MKYVSQEDYVSYSQALELRRLGFTEYCDYIYNSENHICPKVILSYNYQDREDHVDAPTLWQVQSWLRKEKGLIICHEPDFYKGEKPLMGYHYSLYEKDKGMSSYILSSEVYNTLEEAISSGISECIKLLEK